MSKFVRVIFYVIFSIVNQRKILIDASELVSVQCTLSRKMTHFVSSKTLLFKVRVSSE